MENISLGSIENVSSSDLSQRRLDDLQQGHSSFDTVLSSRSDPITLDKSSGTPYKIIDGRHRIYLARKAGYSSIPAQFA